MGKILISGTGRAGTTFLVKLFTLLDFDTGFSPENMNQLVTEKCNAGLEHTFWGAPRVLKNPYFTAHIPHFIHHNIQIQCMIIPIRDYKESALSRVNIGSGPGGLWAAKDEESQITFYKERMADYLHLMVKYDIETIFLDFDKMIKSKEYLFKKLHFLLQEKEIDLETFSAAYDEASESSRRKIENPQPETLSPPFICGCPFCVENMPFPVGRV